MYTLDSTPVSKSFPNLIGELEHYLKLLTRSCIILCFAVPHEMNSLFSLKLYLHSVFLDIDQVSDELLFC